MINQLVKETKTTKAIKKRIDKINIIYKTISEEEQVVLYDILLNLSLLLEIKTLDTDKGKDKDIKDVISAADDIIKMYS
jgi:hypothetical protein